MPSKLFQSPRVDTQTLVDASINVAAGTSSILGAMKALSESHRVLENLMVRAYHSSQTIPLSMDQKLSLLLLLAFLLYCFIIYPFFICPTADIPGPYFTSTSLGYLPHFYHKHHDDTDQWALELHKKYGSVVRLAPTLVSVNDPSLLPINRDTQSLRNSKSGPISSNGWSTCTSQHANGGTTQNDATRLATTTTEKPIREARLFRPIISSVVTDLKTAMRGQNTIDIHELLSRHLREQAAASFATAMAHTIYQLAHPLHRHYLNRLAKDIRTRDSDVHELDLLDAVVKESLRMQQAANHHANAFLAPEGGSMLANYFLATGIEVTVSLYCMCRSSNVFSHPHDFNPDRWLQDTNSKGGVEEEKKKRMDEALDLVLECQRGPNSQFDTTLGRLKVLLAEMLKQFDMKLPLGEQPRQLDVVALKNGGCRVRFRERKRVVEKKVRFAEHVVM